MKRLLKIEKILFYFLVLAFFWQLRLVWQPLGGGFNEWTSIYFYATDLIVVAVLFLWLIRIWQEKLEFHFSWADIFLGAFLAIAGLSIIIASNRLLSGYGFIKLLEMAALFLYVKNNFSKIYDWRTFWHLFIGSALAQSLVAIAQFFIQKSLGLKFFAESPLSPDIAGVAKIVVDGAKVIRAYGLVPHPNILAAILVVALFGLVYLWLEKHQKCHPGLDPGSRSWIPAFAGMTKKNDLWTGIFFILICALLSATLFFTFSRGVIIVGYAFLILWLIYLWFLKIADRKKIISVIVLLFIINCLLLTVYWPYVSSRYDLGALAGSQSVNLRVLYNGVAWDMIKQSQIWGVGQGNFVLVFGQYYDKLQSWVWQPVHNVYLLIAAETGILGLLAFLAFLFLTIRSAWPRPVASGASFTGRYQSNLEVSLLLFAICYLLIVGFFDHFWWDLQQGQIMFWLLLGLLCAHSSRDPVQNLSS